MKPAAMLLSTLFLTLALAAAPPALAAPDDITITAETFTIDEQAHLATFTGKVYVVHPFLELWADKVEVTYGDGGTSDIKTFVATGSVRILNAKQDATGERAVYDPLTQILRLTGKVMVKAGGTILASQEMVVDLATNTSTFTGDPSTGGRVTGIFTQAPP